MTDDELETELDELIERADRLITQNRLAGFTGR